MNSKKLKFILLLGMFIPLSIFLVVDILSGGGNQVGNTLKWSIIAGGAIGFFSARLGVLFFLGFQLYADFIKRLMILGDGLSMQDIMISLGLGPILIIAACIYCSLQCITGRISYSKPLDIIFFIGCVGISLIGVAQGWQKGINDLGQLTLGTALIGMTAYACYCLFREPNDNRTIFKCLVLSGIPMAAYTLWQAAFGIAAWEERYILTGLSSTLYQFYILDGSDIRPFSTLNTHTSVGSATGVLCILAIAFLGRSKSLYGKSSQFQSVYWIIGLIYLAACIASKNRTTYFIPIFYFVSVWAFKGGIRTLILYLGSLTAGILVIANSQFLDDQILYWSSIFERTAIGQKFGTLGTFQSRIQGFMWLTDANYWSPFGLSSNELPASHDVLSDSIMRFGYVPVGFAFLLLSVCLWWWHRSYLKINDPRQKLILVKITAVGFSLVLCGLAYGNLLFVSPINGILGALGGSAVAILRRNREIPHQIPQSQQVGLDQPLLALKQ